MEKPSIGILAGMGPHSTGPFIDMVVRECQRQYGARDDVEFPKIMICSQPAPFYAKTELRIVDAADCLAREIVRQWLLRTSGVSRSGPAFGDG